MFNKYISNDQIYSRNCSTNSGGPYILAYRNIALCVGQYVLKVFAYLYIKTFIHFLFRAELYSIIWMYHSLSTNLLLMDTSFVPKFFCYSEITTVNNLV